MFNKKNGGTEIDCLAFTSDLHSRCICANLTTAKG